MCYYGTFFLPTTYPGKSVLSECTMPPSMLLRAISVQSHQALQFFLLDVAFPSADFLIGKYYVSMSTHLLASSGVRSVGEIYRSKIIRSKVYEFKN